MKRRNLLMIPGPIEFEPAVMRAMSAPTTSHVAPEFVEIFGRALERMRDVFLCPSGQPFVVAGSGTLAMDIAASNLIEPGDRALAISTGYFGDRMADILKRYGATVDTVRAPLGEPVTAEAAEAALSKATYKVMTITHVDTSTGIAADVRALAEVARQHGVLTVVDGVCSVAGEVLRQQEWGVDLALTASQKAIGVPPGLALLVVGSRAMDAWRARKTPVANYYADFANWLPIMQAYEARKPAYFGTPAVNLVAALEVSLGQILAEGMEPRFTRHHRQGRACQAGISALGLRQVPTAPSHTAVTMTACYYPQGVTSGDLLSKVKSVGVILAGGLHPAIKDHYFRVGHMGANNAGDILATVGAIEAGLHGCGYGFEVGVGVAAAQRVLQGVS